MKCATEVEVPPAVVAFTVTVAAACGGEVTLTSVVLTKVTEAAGIVVPPNVTVVAPVMNAVPVRVTVVPPAVGPAPGVILVTVGAATKTKCSPGAEVPPAVVAVTVTVAAACAGEWTLISVVLTNVTEAVG